MQRVGSRRRRASRSAATSPRRQSVVSSHETMPQLGRATARRASIATPETSPRNSSCEFVTVTAAEDGESDPEISLEVYDRSPRGSLAPGFSRSPRNSLVPNDYGRNNLLDPSSGYVRTPRGSLVPEPDQYRSSRTSLIPDECIHYSRSPRNSLAPEYNRSPRNSLVPSADCNNRTHRKSLVPENTIPRSPRGKIIRNIWYYIIKFLREKYFSW